MDCLYFLIHFVFSDPFCIFRYFVFSDVLYFWMLFVLGCFVFSDAFFVLGCFVFSYTAAFWIMIDGYVFSVYNMNNVSENPNIFGTKCEHTQQNENFIFGGNHLGMFGMRKFRYRYTGKNIPVIPVYRYFGLVRSWVLLDLQNHEMDEKSQNIEL